MASETSTIRKTLPGAAYHSDETWAVDKERVFYRTGSTSAGPSGSPSRGPGCVSRSPTRASWWSAARTTQLRAFYNVCRHRGSRICDDESGEVRTHLRCPYHAWGYALDGTLVTTPMIEKDEIDRRVDVSLAGPPRRLGGVRLRQPLPRGAPAAAGAPRRPAGRPAGAGQVRAGRPAHRPRHHQRGPGQLEDRHRELQRVPALPDDPPRAGGRRAGVQEGRHLRGAAAATAASPWPTAARRSSTTRGCGCRCCPGSRRRATRSPTSGPRLPHDVPRRRRLELPRDGGLPDGAAELPAGDRVPLQPRGVRRPRLRPVAGHRVQRAGHRARTTRPASGSSAA